MTIVPFGLILLACVDANDFDRDGFVEPEDCNDNNAAAYPGAVEVPYDRVDQDCDGSDLNDVDGDGWIAREVGGNDCDDSKRRVRPDAEEIPYDGVDQNCDGWNDNDFDRDGYEATGEGGDDCNDFDARVIPLDEDGDGFTPCSGDCDELDPNRYPSAVPVCGNGIEDNCDGVSDCAYFGTGILDEAPMSVVGVSGLWDFGWQIAVPGDVDGDGFVELAVAAYTNENLSAGELLWFHTPLQITTPSDVAYASVLLPGTEIGAVEIGDADGDGRGDVLAAYAGSDGTARVGVMGAPSTLGTPFADAAWFEVHGSALDRVGGALASLDDGARIALGASFADGGAGQVHLLSPVQGGDVAFGEGGARLEGPAGSYAGAVVASLDYDADGVSDLVIEETGTGFLASPFVRLVSAPPIDGVFALEQLSSTGVLLDGWGGALGGTAGGDVDGDGSADLSLGLPNFSIRIGAVAVFTTVPDGAVSPDDADIIRYGLGDDTLGATLQVRDFDGDGADDLVVGAPATISRGGGKYKPGALHVWYGPLVPGSELSLEADWYMLGVASDGRTLAAHDIAFTDVDGDSYDDLLIASPRQLPSGVIQIYPGGTTAMNGI